MHILRRSTIKSGCSFTCYCEKSAKGFETSKGVYYWDFSVCVFDSYSRGFGCERFYSLSLCNESSLFGNKYFTYLDTYQVRGNT